MTAAQKSEQVFIYLMHCQYDSMTRQGACNLKDLQCGVYGFHLLVTAVM